MLNTKPGMKMLAALQQPRFVVQQPNQALPLCSLGQEGEDQGNLNLACESSPAHSLGFAKASASLSKKLGCAKPAQFPLLQKQYVQNPLTLYKAPRRGHLGFYFSSPPTFPMPVFSSSPPILKKPFRVRATANRIKLRISAQHTELGTTVP